MAVWDKHRVFVDTNILFYSMDKDAAAKHERASEVIEAIWLARTGVISTQILSEWAVNLRKKLDLAPIQVERVLQPYIAWSVVMIEPGDTLAAINLADKHTLSYWDSLIVVAAKKGQVDVLLTEDLNTGQRIEGVEIVNPL